jgi:hypothetical protein
MKMSATTHAVLDYLTVGLFAVAPTVLNLQGPPALLSYALAIIHLLLTLTTAFPGGVLRWVPLSWHGWIELAVAPALVVAPWLLGFDTDYAGWYASRT